MLRGFVFCILFFAVSAGFATAQLPRPLPDDRYPKEPYPGEPPRSIEVPYSLGTGEAGKFGPRTTQFIPRIDLNRILKIRLVGARNNIDIREVRLIFADHLGERSELTLTGELGPGGVREVVLDGRRIVTIEVAASSSYFWKRPGKYRVDVVAYGN